MMARSPRAATAARPRLWRNRTTLPPALADAEPDQRRAPVSIGIGGIDAWMKVNAFLGSSQFLEPWTTGPP